LGWLGRKWNEVQNELIKMKVDFISQVTYPENKITPCGDLRVARVSQKDGGRLEFVLLHDRFSK